MFTVESMPHLTFSKAVLWARLESLLGRFWPPGFMFDTPGLRGSTANMLYWGHVYETCWQRLQ